MLSEKHEATEPAYTIVFLDGATIIASTPWGGDLRSAKQQVMDHFSINTSQSGATEVVVLEGDDSTKRVLFSYSPDGGRQGS
jgi:hypothetical protein